jgi:hypothetical protein
LKVLSTDAGQIIDHYRFAAFSPVGVQTTHGSSC